MAVSIRFNVSFHCNGCSQSGCRTNLVHSLLVNGNNSYFKKKNYKLFPPHTQGAAYRSHTYPPPDLHTHGVTLCAHGMCVTPTRFFNLCGSFTQRFVTWVALEERKQRRKSVGRSHPTAVSTAGQEVNTSAGRTSTPPPPTCSVLPLQHFNTAIISTPLRLSTRQRSADRVLIKTMLR